MRKTSTGQEEIRQPRYTEIAEKKKALRELYGGMMSLSDVCRELGTGRDTARAWLKENRLGNRVAKRIRYETDEVAKRIVQGRGMI